ncbi:MAG: hypothetical protein NTX50_11420 [Candidatus Sumerlaeota bacterium]|nr:hypothetical protein [Candidatus Sumerlaeota bacterium]
MEGLTPAIIFRALSASVIIAAIATLFVWGRWGPMVARDFAFFSLWSVGNWFLLAKVITGVVERRPKSILALQLLGLLCLLVILPLFFAWYHPNLLAFAAGFSLPYAIVVLKVAGWHLTHRSARK